MTVKNLVAKLTAVTGPSGAEENVRAVIQSEISPYVDQMKTDPMGNLIACKTTMQGMKAGKKPLRLMLTAHMDEIGMIVTHIDEHGFARFSNLGVIYPHTLVGNRVRFMNGTHGVVGLEKRERADQSPTIEQLYIDTGASSREESSVSIGDMAAVDQSFEDFGGRWVSKALDDRVGLALLIDLIQNIKDSVYDLYFAFTTQEEPGYRGSGPAAYAIEPDLGLAVDVTSVGDTPKGIKMDVSLGKGPAVKIRDSWMISDRRIVRWMTETAEKRSIPYQREILALGGTDAHQIQTSRSGVPSGCLSIPCRYVHTHSEMVDERDVENASKLLISLCQSPIDLEG